MQVFGIGNVTQCNQTYIFLNDDGKQSRVKATTELLNQIKDTAADNYTFYDRMRTDIILEYERRKVDIERKYQFITEEMVVEAFKNGRKEGFSLSMKQQSHNEECIRQYSNLHGFFDGANFASDRKWEAHRLLIQAKDSLKGRI